MPSGAKKRKAAKKKQESSTDSNIKSNNNHDSRSQGERESDIGVSSQEKYKEDAVRIEKDSEERIEIIDSTHDHDKSSSSSSSSSNSSDDESREVKKIDDNKETGDTVSEVITVSSAPIQPAPIAGNVPTMGGTANAIIENTGLMDSATPSYPNSAELVEISHDDTMPEEKSVPEPTEIATEVSLASDEITQTSSDANANNSDVNESEGKTSPLPESSIVPEGGRESDVVISHEEEAPLQPPHGIAQRTSWLSCCGLFDVVTGSSR